MYHLKLILGFCLLVGLTLHAEARRRRRIGGGYLEPIASDNHEVKSLAVWAADKLHGTLIKVVSAKRQVVAGWLYYIDMQMKNRHHQKMTCSVKIWIRHWIRNGVRLVRENCRPVSV